MAELRCNLRTNDAKLHNSPKTLIANRGRWEIIMRILDRTSAERFLSEQGVQPASEVKNVLSGFDFSKAIYEHDFWPGDVVYQFVRLPSATDPAPSTGS